MGSTSHFPGKAEPIVLDMAVFFYPGQAGEMFIARFDWDLLGLLWIQSVYRTLGAFPSDLYLLCL